MKIKWNKNSAFIRRTGKNIVKNTINRRSGVGDEKDSIAWHTISDFSNERKSFEGCKVRDDCHILACRKTYLIHASIWQSFLLLQYSKDIQDYLEYLFDWKKLFRYLSGNLSRKQRTAFRVERAVCETLTWGCVLFMFLLLRWLLLVR